MTDAVKRQYDSTRRQEQARENRQRIIQAAHRLFVSEGYGQTTIADIASAAGVAVETVYAAFRNKQTLLRQVWYVSFRGDEADITLWDRPEIRVVIGEPDLAKRFQAQAVVLTAVFRRITPLMLMLQGAVASQSAAAEMLAEFDERRLDAAGKYSRAAAATGQLAVSEDECRDVLWATLDGAQWHRLVAQRGWSDERFGAWLGKLWISALVTA
jgi:AcrR family transcriptional regulator